MRSISTSASSPGCRGFDPNEDTERDTDDTLGRLATESCRGFDPNEDTESLL